MNKEELAPYEGSVVCFFHRQTSADAVPNRWGRGIVYQGTCYDLSTAQQGRPLTPSVHLRSIRTEYIAELFPLKESQQTSLERAVSSALVRGETTNVSLLAPLIFEAWPAEDESPPDK